MKKLSKEEMKAIFGGVSPVGGNLCNFYCGATAGGASCATDTTCPHCVSQGGQQGPAGQTHVCSRNPEPPM